MDRYKCVKSFEVPLCDDEGRSDENDKKITIKKGTEWNYRGDAFVVLFRGDVRLESDEYAWLEITKDMLDECFEQIT